jgi:outer membrane protein assembly factor BamB
VRGLVLVVLLAACESKPEVPAATPPVTKTQEPPKECTDLPFAPSTPVPEASGAAWLDVDGKPALVVISDSGNQGKYAIVDADAGTTLEEGILPLGEGAGDDLEGIAARGGLFHVISSPGWVRSYKRADKSFELVDAPYALGPIDIEDKGGGMGDKPPKGNGMVCGAKNTNCGRNYEGLCLLPDGVTPQPNARCIGFAASKADGHLYCIQEDRGKLVVQYQNAIRIARPGVVADCAFSDDGNLYAGSNLFDAGTVYRVDGWNDPSTAKLTVIGALGIGFPETLAVRGETFYRMSDTGGVAPSMMRKLRCPK